MLLATAYKIRLASAVPACATYRVNLRGHNPYKAGHELCQGICLKRLATDSNTEEGATQDSSRKVRQVGAPRQESWRHVRCSACMAECMPAISSTSHTCCHQKTRLFGAPQVPVQLFRPPHTLSLRTPGAHGLSAASPHSLSWHKLHAKHARLRLLASCLKLWARSNIGKWL